MNKHIKTNTYQSRNKPPININKHESIEKKNRC